MPHGCLVVHDGWGFGPNQPPTNPLTVTTASTRYAWCFAEVTTRRRDGSTDRWGNHPCLVRLTDGLVMPCTGAAPRRGEPVRPMPADWMGRPYIRGGVVARPWAKPLAAGAHVRSASLHPITRPDVVAAADAAYEAADLLVAFRQANT